MLYDSKRKILYSKGYNLTEQEETFLFILSNNGICKFEELEKYGIDINNARVIKSRLVKKTGMKLTTIQGVGYRLDNKNIFFM